MLTHSGSLTRARPGTETRVSTRRLTKESALGRGAGRAQEPVLPGQSEAGSHLQLSCEAGSWATWLGH